MRLRPSLGQLRLQREADSAETRSLQAQVCLALHPEQLRATVHFDGCAGAPRGSAVQMELSFPPQYPHRAPAVTQVLPEGPLPSLEYDGRAVLLERVRDSHWSSVMGVADIVRDLVQSIRPRLATGTLPEVACAGGARREADDVDMS